MTLETWVDMWSADGDDQRAEGMQLQTSKAPSSSLMKAWFLQGVWDIMERRCYRGGLLARPWRVLVSWKGVWFFFLQAQGGVFKVVSTSSFQPATHELPTAGDIERLLTLWRGSQCSLPEWAPGTWHMRLHSSGSGHAHQCILLGNKI